MKCQRCLPSMPHSFSLATSLESDALHGRQQQSTAPQSVQPPPWYASRCFPRRLPTLALMTGSAQQSTAPLERAAAAVVRLAVLLTPLLDLGLDDRALRLQEVQRLARRELRLARPQVRAHPAAQALEFQSPRCSPQPANHSATGCLCWPWAIHRSRARSWQLLCTTTTSRGINLARYCTGCANGETTIIARQDTPGFPHNAEALSCSNLQPSRHGPAQAMPRRA